MKTNQEHFLPHSNLGTNISNHHRQRGNALIYVLIAIALFTALSFTLGRQTGTDEAATLDEERAELLATQLIATAAQTKSVIDQMMFTGSEIDDMIFIQPGEAGFEVAPHIHKLYHPEGGGLNRSNLPTQSVQQGVNAPPPGWYLGRFNNVDWTRGSGQDVILTAYQIKEAVCARINTKITGTDTIPQIGDDIRDVLIDATTFSGANTDFTTDPDNSPICGACYRLPSLCVQNGDGTAYAFYTIVADQ